MENLMTIEEMYGGLPRLKITKDILIRFELWSNIVDDEEYENVYGLTKRELHGYLSDFGELKDLTRSDASVLIGVCVNYIGYPRDDLKFSNDISCDDGRNLLRYLEDRFRL